MIFKKDHFSIYKGKQYPPFFRVIQSVYSPLLGNRGEDYGTDGSSYTPYTCILTFGLWKEEGKGYGMSLCSILHKKILDPLELIQRIKLMKKDYLNKSTSKSTFVREANELIIERNTSEKGPFTLYGQIDDYTFFFPEYFGGNNLINRLSLGTPLLEKVYLMTIPEDSDELRADDKYFLSMLMSFPSNESYSIASALLQSVLYADRRWFNE